MRKAILLSITILLLQSHLVEAKDMTAEQKQGLKDANELIALQEQTGPREGS